MTFEILPAMAAGLIGTIVMSALMAMAKAVGMTNMPPMPLVLGSMMSDDKKTASLMGAMIHFIIMGTIVFGAIYAALFTAFDDATVAIGAGIGLVHGVIVGAMALPMMPALNRRMTPAVEPGTPVVTTTNGHLSIAAPGFFGIRWGSMTPVGIIVGHVVFGIVVAVAYTAFV